ncbi:MAG: TrpR-like protein, YerC/YecD [Oscillospiraceae bacterium]|nr:TrpR-like protein, YerC/YecD [Oscillospiraceae bacterium]
MNQNTENNLDLLYEAILCLETKEECAAFFEDLCTALELNSISQRMLVAKMLTDKKVYNSIALSTGASTATISRVNRTLNSKYSGKGYKTVIERLKKKGIDVNIVNAGEEDK